MEWFAILIPTIVCLILGFGFKRHVVWWEVFLPMLPVFIIVPFIKFSAEYSLVNDYERHGGWVVEARYFEDWNEYISKTCTREVGSGKNKTTETYDCSYVEYHPPIWEVEDSNGYVKEINEGQFINLTNKFNNRHFVDLNRHYYTNDGDEYITRWQGNQESFQPFVTEHRYENRVQATHGVINFPPISKKEARNLGLYDYPELKDCFYDPVVLGDCQDKQEADKILQTQNAKLGARKQVRFWVLIFHDKPREIGFDQESYWIGGNKNEIVVSIGLDSTNKVMWCHPFCWSPDGYANNDVMRINIRDYVEKQKEIKLVDTANFIVEEALDKFQRKHFKEFSYLAVDTPTWAYWVIYILTIISTGVISFIVVTNNVINPSEEDSLKELLA